MPGPRANSEPVQAGVVPVRAAKVTGTAGVCVAVIININVRKAWTPQAITKDCFILPFGLQRKLRRR
jgi:hypothetical protein